MSEPWAVVEGHTGTMTAGWGDVPPWLPPGPLAAAHRAEAQARAAERREAEQRAQRVEAHRNAAIMVAHQYAVMTGQPWSPADPFASWPSPDAIGEAMFAEQDREARRAEFQAAREAGLVHVLNLSPDMVAVEPREQVADRAQRTELVRAHNRTYNEGIRARARRALARIGGRQR